MKKILQLILFLLFTIPTTIGQSDRPNIQFGIGLSSTFNFRVQPHSPGFNPYRMLHHQLLGEVSFNDHGIYIGPQYFQVLGFSPYPATGGFINHGTGMNIGYFYEHNKSNNHWIHFMLKYDVSLFTFRYYDLSMGAGVSEEMKKLLVSNTFQAGANLTFLKQLNCFIGIGGGSAGYFIFNLGQPIWSSNVSLSYRF